MRPSPRRALLTSLPLAAFAAAALLVSSARADLPPPEGTKRVPYGFVVENQASFPDYVLLVFPWSLSNGAPTREYSEVKDGERVGVGRRVMATPKLWAMKKTDHEAWRGGLKDGATPEALDALFGGSQVIDCNFSLRPNHQLPDTDPAEEIVDHYRVKNIAEGVCEIEENKKSTESGEPTAPATTPAAKTAPEQTDAKTPASSPPESSSSCAIDSRPGPAGLLLLLTLVGIRRRTPTAST